jgi:hypothetical protein
MSLIVTFYHHLSMQARCSSRSWTVLNQRLMSVWATAPPLNTGPLLIKKLDCLKSASDECLGDCPDAAYFGPNILDDSDDIEMLRLQTDDDLHVVTMVDHRALSAAKYGSSSFHISSAIF